MSVPRGGIWSKSSKIAGIASIRSFRAFSSHFPDFGKNTPSEGKACSRRDASTHLHPSLHPRDFLIFWIFWQFSIPSKFGDFCRNRRKWLENIESKSFWRSLDRFESIWIDSETLIFRRFEPGSLSTFFRTSDLENLKSDLKKWISGPGHSNSELGTFDFGPQILEVFLRCSKIWILFSKI